MEIKEHDTIVVLDFGAQYSQLIARRVREQHVYSYIVPYTTSALKIKELSPKGIIFSGGPASVSTVDSPRPDPAIFDLGIPILGICYGLQVMSIMNGGEVERPLKREYGFAHLQRCSSSSALLQGIDDKSVVWMSHGDSVKKLFDGAVCTCSTENCEFTVVEDDIHKLYGVQFHPEVVHTPQGSLLIRNFVVNICKARTDWSMESFIETEIEKIRKVVGDKQVLCGLSGGVDSSVVAALLHKAIGDQLICVFVNNGLLRKGEADLVLSVFKEHFKIRLQYAHTEDLFLDALKGVSDPETKRKIVGKVFIDVFEKEARAEEIAKLLGNNRLWHSHGRSIGINTLKTVLKLKIDDYSDDTELSNKIRNYNDLLCEYILRHGAKAFLHSRIFFYLTFTFWHAPKSNKKC